MNEDWIVIDAKSLDDEERTIIIMQSVIDDLLQRVKILEEKQKGILFREAS